MLTRILLSELARRKVEEEEERAGLLEFLPHLRIGLIQGCNDHTRLADLCDLFDVTPESQEAQSRALTYRLWYDAYWEPMGKEIRWTMHDDPGTCAVLWDELLVVGTTKGNLCVWSADSPRRIDFQPVKLTYTSEVRVCSLWVMKAGEGHPSYLYATLENGVTGIFSRDTLKQAVGNEVDPPVPTLTMVTHDDNWRVAHAKKSHHPVMFSLHDFAYYAWEISGVVKFRKLATPDVVYNYRSSERIWLSGERLIPVEVISGYRVDHLCAGGGWVAWWSSPRERGWAGVEALMITHIDWVAWIVPSVVDLTQSNSIVTCCAITKPNTLLIGFRNGGILQYTLSMDKSGGDFTKPKVVATLVGNLDTGLGDVINIYCHPEGTRYAVASSTDMVRIYDGTGVVRTIDLQKHRGTDRRRRENRSMRTERRIICLSDDRLFCYEQERNVCHVWSFGPMPGLDRSNRDARLEEVPKKRTKQRKRKRGRFAVYKEQHQ